MKKILFLMLSVAVATSAFATARVNGVQKSLPQTNKVTAVTKAEVKTANAVAHNFNAPKVQKQQQMLMPCEGLRVLERNTRAVVTDQPAGTVVNYQRGGKALTLTYQSSSWYYTNADQSGFVTAVEDGNTIWFKNLFYDPEGYWDDYWFQATKSGNTVTMPLGQDVYYSSSYSAYVRLAWGSTYVNNGSLGLYINTNKTEATFTIDGDVLTLDGAQFTSNYTGQGLVLYWTDDNTFGGMALYNTTLTRVSGEIPEAPVMYSDDDIEAMSGEWVNYYRIGAAIYRVSTETGVGLEIGDQKGYGYIFYDEDGTTVYMRDPVYTWRTGMWIKGTKEGNTLTFPLGQYVYWDDETFLGLKTSWGTFVNGSGYTDDPTVTEVSFTVNGEYIILNNAGMDEETDTYTGISLLVDSAFLDPGWFGGLDFMTVYCNIPAVPTNVTVDPGSTTATVAWQDAVNSMWNVRYRVWVDPSTVEYYFNGFETDEDLASLTGWDMDGDDNWWSTRSLDDGTTCLTSASYDNNSGPLTPDNWLVIKDVPLDGVVKLTAWGQDPNYAAEVFKVYVYVGELPEELSDPEDYFVAIGNDVTTDGTPTEYVFTIPEEYCGQTGYVAIRHYNVTDEFMLNIDDLYVGDPDGGSVWEYVYDIEDLQTVLEGLTPETTYEVQVQGANLGGVGSWTDAVTFTTLAAQAQGLRGDVNEDGFVNISDVTDLISALLTDGWDTINVDNANCNLDETLNISDVTALINFLLTDQWDD
ncbi:MAG: hypothetical protein IKX56_08245 [Muribaculaceae bacterium]|nr:hypothetical protein [Muribaculaceae bacterium]